MATVIASQATISGAFSMAQQSTLLGLSPRVRIQHTSPSEFGQIYVPAVNWLQLAGVLGIVLVFKTGPDIASAYGIAVTGTMLVTTMLVLTLAVRGWNWPWSLAIPLFVLLLVVDGTLFSANMLKFVEGGWVPLVIAAVIFIAMWTWYQRPARRGAREKERTLPVDSCSAPSSPARCNRPQGTAIYLTTFADSASSSLMQNLRHNGVLHEHVVLLTIQLRDEPFVARRIAQRGARAGQRRAPRRAVLRLHGEARRGHDLAPLATTASPSTRCTRPTSSDTTTS